MMSTAIVCEKRIYSEIVISHHHTHVQFLFPLHVSMDLKTDNHKIKLTPENCFYLAPYTDHLFHSVERNEFLVLDIPERMLPEKTGDMYENMDESWSAVKYLLMEEVKNAENPAALGNLTNYIANKIRTVTTPSIKYINKTFTNQLKLVTYAHIENYHPSYDSKLIKKQPGKI